MRELGRRFMSLSPEEREAVMQRASAELREGGGIIMPTESIYGLFVRADDHGAQLLAQLTKRADFVHTPLFTLHMADLDWIMPLLEIESAVIRRLIHKLMPGPVRMVLRQPEEVQRRVREKLGVSAGVIDRRDMIAFRVPDHPVARRVIRDSGHPTLARGVGVTVWGGRGGADLRETTVYSDSDAPKVIIDDGPTMFGQTASTVDLWPDGRFQVGRQAAVKEDFIMDKLITRVLFVCTGNTCRSPMAEGLAREWEKQRIPDGLSFEIESAGIAAGEGQPASDQTLEVLRERGIDLSTHRARQLTVGMVDRADIVFTMTPSHAQAVMQLAPGSVHKVFPIDPVRPIDDPIGRPIEVYRDVADQLQALIETRFKEIIDE
ncbi:MAG: Sua5/YciO/YrdC/YwlC family protein [Phycisphaerales bacterium]|nr:Sua5/YciO/YrdC/YwlC family protein [Phycisphaerales bacterium]